MSTEWKSPNGFEGLYEVSNTGLVRSLDRIDSIGRRRKGGLLAPRMSKGYGSVVLHKDGVRYNWKIHALVLHVFVGPRPDGAVCRHLNGNQSDNNVCNLAYGTQMDNVHDMISHGTMSKLKSSDCWKTNLSDMDVEAIRRKYAETKCTQELLCKEYGLTQSSMSEIILGKTWKDCGGPIRGRDYVR
ncbi:MAG: NUMOD4 domain-containing protein [Pseudomonadota bacterium]|nr:NUMOD4 domain-containing protein [Pseudomonadota bacterium]